MFADLSPRLLRWRALLASSRLTVALLGASIGLVLAGTLAQRTQGLVVVQQEYFRAFVLYARWGGLAVPWFPGGYTLGTLLLANLAAAALARPLPRERRPGLALVHGGVLLLLAGELVSGLVQEEYRLRLAVGESQSHLESVRDLELAFTDTAPPGHDEVVAFPLSQLAPGTVLQHSRLPFRVVVRAIVPHAVLGPRGPGADPEVVAEPPPRGPGARRQPAARLALGEPEGPGAEFMVARAAGPRPLAIAGRTWTAELRPRRVPQPWTLTLRELRHERHEGTTLARTVESRLRLGPAGGGPGRDVVVALNAPWRHAGLTFYQAGLEAGERATVLQVVRHPAWGLPYLAGALLVAGLLRLAVRGAAAARSRPAPVPAAGIRGSWPATAAVLGVAGALAAWGCRPVRAPEGFDLAAFGRLPALEHGRVKPLDTVARAALLVLQGRQRVALPGGGELPPVAWLLDVLHAPERAAAHPVFEVTHPELIALLGLGPAAEDGRRRFAWRELAPRWPELEDVAARAALASLEERSSFAIATLRLRAAGRIFQGLQAAASAPGVPGFQDEVASLAEGLDGVARAAADPGLLRAFLVMDRQAGLRLVPPSGPGPGWRTLGAAWRDAVAAGTPDPSACAHLALGRAWRAGEPVTFNAAVEHAAAAFAAADPAGARRVRLEALLNAVAPFTLALVPCGLAAVLGLLAWLRPWPAAAGPAGALAALGLLLLAAGLGARMAVEGRPPVTNLHSSALFVAATAAFLGLLLERRRRDGLGALLAGALGSGCLVVAHHLALAGDTLEALRAVLDSNLWLGTHVVAITAGYAATLVAGTLGVAQLVRGAARRSTDPATEADLFRATRWAVAVALGLNVAGTVLGGIWADQAWGRFWGWDPKENGALLIILWNALTLHARVAGLAGPRGFAALATLGNVVTVWSWFGVNLLGIGLHSYGATTAAPVWLTAFTVAHLLVALWALVPDGRGGQTARGPGQLLRSISGPAR